MLVRTANKEGPDQARRFGNSRTFTEIFSGEMVYLIHSKPSILFVGHRQRVQTQIMASDQGLCFLHTNYSI